MPRLPMIVSELSRSSLGFRIEFYTAMCSSGTELEIRLQNRTVLGQEYKPKLSEEEISCDFYAMEAFWLQFYFDFKLLYFIFTYIPWFQRQLPDWEFRFLSISNQFQFEPCWFFILRSQVTYFHSWKQWKYGKQSWHTSYPFKLITSFVCT